MLSHVFFPTNHDPPTNRENFREICDFLEKPWTFETISHPRKYGSINFSAWARTLPDLAVMIIVSTMASRDFKSRSPAAAEGVGFFWLGVVRNSCQPWEPKSLIYRGYNPYIGGLKPSFFMVLGSHGGFFCCCLGGETGFLGGCLKNSPKKLKISHLNGKRNII